MVAEGKRFPRVTAVIYMYTRYDDVAISNATINATIRYSNLAHMGDCYRQQLFIQNCGKTAADRDMVTTDNVR